LQAVVALLLPIRSACSELNFPLYQNEVDISSI
jgi:hypothetical protein